MSQLQKYCIHRVFISTAHNTANVALSSCSVMRKSIYHLKYVNWLLLIETVWIFEYLIGWVGWVTVCVWIDGGTKLHSLFIDFVRWSNLIQLLSNTGMQCKRARTKKRFKCKESYFSWDKLCSPKQDMFFIKIPVTIGIFQWSVR